MRARRICSCIALLWLSVLSCTQAARSSYESLYSGSGHMLQTDSGNPPYSVAGRFVISMRRSFFNVAGGQFQSDIFTRAHQTTHYVLQHWVALHVQAGARPKICAGRYVQQAWMESPGALSLSLRFQSNSSCSCVQPNNCVLPNSGDTVTLLPGPQDGVRTRIAFSDGTFIENMQVLAFEFARFHIFCACVVEPFFGSRPKSLCSTSPTTSCFSKLTGPKILLLLLCPI